jgi:hypothetical protein
MEHRNNITNAVAAPTGQELQSDSTQTGETGVKWLQLTPVEHKKFSAQAHDDDDFRDEKTSLSRGEVSGSGSERGSETTDQTRDGEISDDKSSDGNESVLGQTKQEISEEATDHEAFQRLMREFHQQSEEVLALFQDHAVLGNDENNNAPEATRLELGGIFELLENMEDVLASVLDYINELEED